MGIITDGTGRVSIDPADYPLLSPDTVRKVLTDLTARPWSVTMPPAEKSGKTGAVACSSGPAMGAYFADRWRAVDRDLSSSTGWGYRYFDERPVIGGKCNSRAAVITAVNAQSNENRDRARQFVALTSEVGRQWVASSQSTGNVGRMAGVDPSSSSSAASARAPRAPVAPARPGAFRGEKLRAKLQSTPLGARFARRVDSADFAQGLRDTLRARLVAAGQTPADAAADSAAVVEEAVAAQAEAVATSSGLSAEMQALLDAVYPLSSAERYAELYPSLPVEVQNLIAQYAQTFQAVGLE